MRTIQKWALSSEPQQIIKMPRGATPLEVGLQNGLLYLWGAADPTQEPTDRFVRVYRTGDVMPDWVDQTHLGSVQYDGETRHVFWERQFGDPR